jgi:branched-subunit amino acid aminotransferase/4-amino-4-deoxychorismate lyase
MRRQRALVDGREVMVGNAWDPTVTNFGHFTAMQVRAGRTRGLDLHLGRLGAASREMFDLGLSEELVRHAIREALGEDQDASVRVYVIRDGIGHSVSVTVGPPGDPPSAPQRLRSVGYQRPLAHLKHLGGFRIGGLDAQTYFARQAERAGFDDALFTGLGGAISEATIANIGFFDGPTIVWPSAPALAGITMQVLQRELTPRAVAWRSAPVRLVDLNSFEGAFLTNSRGIWAVNGIDAIDYVVDAERMARLLEAYESATWDEI